jgi:hypothetical protein
MISHLWGVLTGGLTEYNRSNGGIELLSMEYCLFLRTPLQFLHILTAFSHFSAFSLLLVFGHTITIRRDTLPRNSVVHNLARGDLFDLASWRIEDEQDRARLWAPWQLGR